MADGREFRSKLVLSDAGAANTFDRLLPADLQSVDPLRARLRRLEPSTAHCSLYLGLSGSDRELGLTGTNLWTYPSFDHDGNVERFAKDVDAPFPGVYISFPSSKDPSFAERYPGKSTMEAIAMLPREPFARWNETRWKRRGGDYEELKQRLAERLRAEVERHVRHWPGTSPARSFPHHCRRGTLPTTAKARSTASPPRRSDSSAVIWGRGPRFGASILPDRMHAAWESWAHSTVESSALQSHWGRTCSQRFQSPDAEKLAACFARGEDMMMLRGAMSPSPILIPDPNPDPGAAAWPALPQSAWSDSCATLQLWLQIVGKIRLALTPPINHCWNVTLYPTARGLTTSPMPHGNLMLEIDFDFIDHTLGVETSAGSRQNFPLKPMTVAEFYQRLMNALEELAVPVRIWPTPCEIADPIRFDRDTVHGSYDAEFVQRFWRILLQTTRVFTVFRARFRGKVSPVHLFWGALDLACTRFSGRTAPQHPSMAGLPDRVTRDAYSHEVSSCGFWLGAPGVEPFFYSYAYPEPAGYAACPIAPAGASFNASFGE